MTIKSDDRPASARGPLLKVALVMRKGGPGQFSVERIFRDISSSLPPDIEARVVEVPCSSRGVIRRLWNLLFVARVRGDVIHITGDIQYCAIAVRRQRCVLTVLDLVSLRRLTGWKRWVVHKLWYWLPLRRAGVVTAISERVRDELVSLHPYGKKAVVVPCPVGPGFSPAEERPPPSPFTLLQVGTKPNKNLETVVRAVDGLAVRVWVIGPLSAEQVSLLDGCGVDYDHRAAVTERELLCAYRSSSALVFVSTYEGFGLPIVEAQACGLPVITSNIPPMTDVAGDAALTVDPHDEGAIRLAIMTLIDDTEQRLALADAGLANVRRFSLTDVAESYAHLYRAAAV